MYIKWGAFNSAKTIIDNVAKTAHSPLLQTYHETPPFKYLELCIFATIKHTMQRIIPMRK